YRRYPALAAVFMDSFRRYNEACSELEQLHEAGRLLHICPSRPIEVGAIEGDVQKLYDLYCEGRRDALAWLPALRQYLIGS
ncbi:MAG: patatin family protein, partial [Clostridia bacterium]|nr:patatin family protein [Clostridia bacterium]